MSDLPDELPSDPAELRAFAAALLDRCARLERLLKLAKDAQFGRSSEKLDADQLQLVLEDIDQAVAALEAAEDRANPKTREKRAAERRANRGKLPEHLPRIIETLMPAATCCAHSRDGDQVFQAMVITDSSDRDQVRRRTRLTGLSVLEMASSSRLAGWFEDRLGGPWEGPVRGAECPHERRSDARGRGLWAGGAIGREVLTVFLFASLTPQAVAFELDAVGIVNDAVQYRIAEGGIGNDVMPLRHGDLTCDQQGSLVVTIVDDLKQITALVGGERFGSPVVEDEEIDALERGDQARQTAFSARLGEIGEQAGCSLVEDGEAVAAGLVAERAGKPGLAGAGWADNDQVVAVTDPLTGDEVLEERTIETTGGAIVDVLDGGGLTELGTGQAAREAAVVAGSDLAIDEEAEPIGVRHPGRLGIVLQFDEGIGHGGEAECAQAIDGGVKEHANLS